MTGFFIFLALWAFKPGSFVPFSILNAWKKVCKVHEHCTQQQNQPASDGYAFFKCTPRDSIARTIGRQIWIKHSHKGIIRRSLQRFILASILIINKIVSEGCILSVQSTLVLRTPRYYGHPSIADKRHPPEKRRKKWLKYTPAITDSRYHGNADTFITPSTPFHLLFLLL